jgi:hypothetical protein
MKTPMRRILDHFDNRFSELGAAAIMLGLAAHIAAWPGALEASEFSQILRVLPPACLFGGFLLSGSARLAALVANGSWPHYGPWLRALGALSGALIWFQICIALYLSASILGVPPSLQIPVYFVLALLELLSMYRALTMVKYAKAA